MSPRERAETESKLANSARGRAATQNERRSGQSGLDAKLVGEVLDMSYHRNGVSGRGFWTILFEGNKHADSLVKGHRFVATFFHKEDGETDENGNSYVPEEACVAVLRLADLNEGNAELAWRGDHFQQELQHIVDTFVWKSDRATGVLVDGAGREMTNRRAAIKAQKEKSS